MFRFETEYSTSIWIAAVCSLLIHLVGLLLLGTAYTRSETRLEAPEAPAPLVLNLEPKPPPPAPPSRQLIEEVTPSMQAPEETDLIAEVDSEAMDTELREGDDPGPQAEEESEFDAMPAPPVPPVPQPEPAQPAPPQPAPRMAEAPAAPPGQASEAPKKPAPAPKPQQDELADRSAADPQESPPEETPGLERMQVARANPPPEIPPALPRESKGRLHDEVMKEGFMNYEAMQDDIAPYMKEVRRRVEVKWTELLVTRYTGATQTKAVVDCKIGPDGQLISAEIVKAPDRLFGGICINALQRAAPFPPFPFTVPDMFREKNLEIRWTFNFL